MYVLGFYGAEKGANGRDRRIKTTYTCTSKYDSLYITVALVKKYILIDYGEVTTILQEMQLVWSLDCYALPFVWYFVLIMELLCKINVDT